MADSILFDCNICGARNRWPAELFNRESAPCRRCSSTVRMRSAICALSEGLYGRRLAIPEFPLQPRFRGVGLSDWQGYARRLRRRLDYRNTFLDRRPQLDITRVPPSEYSTCDFLTVVDVLEHVPAPVENAFVGIWNMLRPGGRLVLAVPYSMADATEEHFPRLGAFELVTVLGQRCLVNKKGDGTFEIFSDLKFHGGVGQTLEMRLFCLRHILELLQKTGFRSSRILEDAPEWGVLYDNICSRTILAFKPC